MAWMLSPAAAGGPLLSQPARTVAIISLGVLSEDTRLDPAKIRELLLEVPWDRFMRLNPVDVEPVAPRPEGWKAAPEKAAFEVLPPALAEMAERMGGVPAWWDGSGGTSGRIALPGDPDWG